MIGTSLLVFYTPGFHLPHVEASLSLPDTGHQHTFCSVTLGSFDLDYASVHSEA